MSSTTLTDATTMQADRKFSESSYSSISYKHIAGIALLTVLFSFITRHVLHAYPIAGQITLGIVGSWLSITLMFTLNRILVAIVARSRFYGLVWMGGTPSSADKIWPAVKALRGSRKIHYGERLLPFSRFIRIRAFLLYAVIAAGWGVFLGTCGKMAFNAM